MSAEASAALNSSLSEDLCRAQVLGCEFEAEGVALRQELSFVQTETEESEARSAEASASLTPSHSEDLRRAKKLGREFEAEGTALRRSSAGIQGRVPSLLRPASTYLSGWCAQWSWPWTSRSRRVVWAR